MTSAAESYADFKRFWELVRRVRGQIEIGLVSQVAKDTARELFQVAERELQRKEAKEHAHV